MYFKSNIDLNISSLTLFSESRSSIAAIVMPKQSGSHASKYFFAATADLKHIYRLVQLSEERATCPAVLFLPVAVKTNERLHLTLPDSGGQRARF